MKSLKPFGLLVKTNKLPDHTALLTLVRIHKLVLVRGLPRLTRNQLLSLTSRDLTAGNTGRPLEEPARIVAIQCLQIPAPEESELRFSNTQSLWNRADAATRAKWERLRFTYRGENSPGAVSSAFVQSHPDTGATYLRISEPRVAGGLELTIEGLAEDPVVFLAELRRQLQAREHCYSHLWEPNDILLVDNLSVVSSGEHQPRSSNGFHCLELR